MKKFHVMHPIYKRRGRERVRPLMRSPCRGSRSSFLREILYTNVGYK